MFEKVPTSTNFVAGEHEVLKFWDDTKAFDKLRQKNAGKPPWSFLDGPITANNPMGVHHAWGRTYKDCYQRYFAMCGHELRYQNGFDCQGLWVEVLVERELGFNTKRDIEAYGLEKFINQCKDRVHTYSGMQAEQSIRLGYWMDWNHSYFTMSDENNYTIWSFLKKCHQRGLIYLGLDAMPWCPRCGTGISEQERREGYKQIADRAVYVRLPLRGRENEYLLVWTTTPWTLAANVACAVSRDLTYVKARIDGKVHYLSKGCLPAVRDVGETTVEAEMPGQALLGWEYDGPFDELPAVRDAIDHHRVIEWDEVTEGEGTGVVHIAPGCGKEDFGLAKELGLPVLGPIDDAGIYVDGYGFLTGRDAAQVADDVGENLRAKGYLVNTEMYTHDYPHCWRCKTQLLFRAVDEWFINMSWRDEIKEVARQIRWIPEWGLDFELDWLGNMGDWMISKKRYWGLALPIFRCECGWFDVVGGRDELKERAVEGWDAFDGHSPHRPWIDAVKIRCDSCGKPVARIPDVGNPWLDAGIVPYSTVRYNADRDYWAKWIPADLVTECFPGQFRNWFYALLAMSTMMENIPPFKTLLGHALVRDEHGNEMSKSEDCIWFDDAAERMGVDVMRWLYCRQNPVNNLNFGFTIGQQVERKVFNTLWNTYAFLANYARLDRFDPRSEPVPVAERPEMDRWLLSSLNLLVRSARTQMPQFNVAALVRQAEAFIESLSNWYVRRNRRRFWRVRSADDRDKLAAYQTLYEVLVTLVKVLAPVVPFVTERIYQNLVRSWNPDAVESVHHTDFPEVRDELIDEKLSTDMQIAERVVNQALSLRETQQLRVRQPLSEIRVVPGSADQAGALERLEAHVLDELNVKRLVPVDTLDDLTTYALKPNFAALGPRYGKAVKAIAQALAQADPDQVVRAIHAGRTHAVQVDGKPIELSADDLHIEANVHEHWAVNKEATVALNVDITPELRREGLARDVVRHVQQLRKDSGLEIEDHIELWLKPDSADLAQAITQWQDYIQAETLCDTLHVHAHLEPAKQAKLGGGTLGMKLGKSS